VFLFLVGFGVFGSLEGIGLFRDLGFLLGLPSIVIFEWLLGLAFGFIIDVLINSFVVGVEILGEGFPHDVAELSAVFAEFLEHSKFYCSYSDAYSFQSCFNSFNVD